MTMPLLKTLLVSGVVLSSFPDSVSPWASSPGPAQVRGTSSVPAAHPPAPQGPAPAEPHPQIHERGSGRLPWAVSVWAPASWRLVEGTRARERGASVRQTDLCVRVGVCARTETSPLDVSLTGKGPWVSKVLWPPGTLPSAGPEGRREGTPGLC